MHLLAIKVEADKNDADDADEAQGNPDPDPDVAVVVLPAFPADIVEAVPGQRAADPRVLAGDPGRQGLRHPAHRLLPRPLTCIIIIIIIIITIIIIIIIIQNLH